MFVCVFVCLLMCVYVCVCLCVFVCVCLCVYIYIGLVLFVCSVTEVFFLTLDSNRGLVALEGKGLVEGVTASVGPGRACPGGGGGVFVFCSSCSSLVDSR